MASGGEVVIGEDGRGGFGRCVLVLQPLVGRSGIGRFSSNEDYLDDYG